MSINIVHHKIEDNLIMINNSEAFLLGAQRIDVGVENSDRQEILKDETTGLNYSRNAVESQEIYNLKTQKHHPWFILDLETGYNPHRWYPGCEIHGDVLGQFEIKESEDESSTTLFSGSDVTLKILDIEEYNEIPTSRWYRVTHAGVTGYLKCSEVSNVKYSDPF